MTRNIIASKKAAEVPVAIFVIGVIALLFLLLVGAFGVKRNIADKTLSINSMQEAYMIENTINYAVDSALRQSVEESYSQFASNYEWINSGDSPDIDGYKNLPAFNSNFDNEFKKDINSRFLDKIEAIKEVNPIFQTAIYGFMEKLKEDKNLIPIEVNGDKATANLDLSYSLTITSTFYKLGVFGLRMFSDDTIVDYYWNYNNKLKVEESLLDLGLESFIKIFNAAVECKAMQDSEIKACMEGKIVNFDVNSFTKENNVFFELTSKKEFKSGRISMKFYLGK